MSPEKSSSLIQLQAQQSTRLLQVDLGRQPGGWTGTQWPHWEKSRAHTLKLSTRSLEREKKDVLIHCSCRSAEVDTMLPQNFSKERGQDLSSQCWTKCV